MKNLFSRTFCFIDDKLNALSSSLSVVLKKSSSSRLSSSSDARNDSSSVRLPLLYR
jgi:hypothetical protein